MNSAAIDANQEQSFFRRWAFRCLAVVLGLSPFLILETALRMTGWQPTVAVGDPFVDFHSVRPLFVADKENLRMVTASNRLDFFSPESFAIDKAPDAYRIVCVGGSTVQGRPYSIETSFTTWLRLNLEAADMSRKWEVINCGGVSYASYRLVPIVKEMLSYDPDLIILYTGHNEFLEDRSYAAAKNAPRYLSEGFTRLSRLRGLQYLYQSITRDPQQSTVAKDLPILPTEVDAMLDARGGLESYHRDAAWRQVIVEHFESNLRRIIDLSNRAKVPIVLVDPAANLRDCSPFKSQHTDGLSSDALATVKRLVAEANELEPTHADRAIELLEQTIAMDPDHAATHFRLATLYTKSGRHKEAKIEFQMALEQDVCPLRIIEPLHQMIHRAAGETRTACVEIKATFEQASDEGIPGDAIFFDHVHPSFHGHQVIAEELMNQLKDSKVVDPIRAWQAQRDRLFEEHWKSLDTVYFERGKQRLGGLQTWTKTRLEIIDRP